MDNHLEKLSELEVLRWVNPLTLKQWSFKLEDPLIHDSIQVKTFVDIICRTAAGYQDLGIQKGDRVILFVTMSVQMYTAMFALQRIGAIPVFLDSWARHSHLGISARIVSPSAMISFEKAFELCAAVPELAQIPIKISVGPTTKNYTARSEELLKTGRYADVAPVEQEHTALITFTTGSSGNPKGADRSHRFLFAQHYALDRCIPYFESDRDLPVFPIFSLNNIAAGVGTVIPAFDIGTPGEQDPLILLAQLKSAKVTCTTLSPSLFNRLSEYCIKEKIQLDFLSRVVTGGAPVSRDNLVDFKKIAPRAEILVLFGSTEVEPMAHIEAGEMIAFKSPASEDPEWVDEGVNVGHMTDELQYRFLKIQKESIIIRNPSDWKELEVLFGEVGELIVAGEHVCRNYYNDEEAFSRAKIRDENGIVWHRTGDLGRIDESGYLWIVGRVHNAIQRAGKYSFPVRAEMILKKIPSVNLAAFLGVPDPVLGEKTVCVVTLHSPNVNIEADIRRIMTKNAMTVDQVLTLDNIPMDPRHHSKVEYDSLRKTLIEQALV